MAKFTITFVGASNADEEVTAESYKDRPPFVDFVVWNEAGNEEVTVARYRADAIKRILRQD